MFVNERKTDYVLTRFAQMITFCLSVCAYSLLILSAFHITPYLDAFQTLVILIIGIFNSILVGILRSTIINRLSEIQIGKDGVSVKVKEAQAVATNAIKALKAIMDESDIELLQAIKTGTTIVIQENQRERFHKLLQAGLLVLAEGISWQKTEELTNKELRLSELGLDLLHSETILSAS